MACADDVPTLEALAAVDLLRRHVPGLRIRVVNVVDLMTLQPDSVHPDARPAAGLAEFDLEPRSGDGFGPCRTLRGEPRAGELGYPRRRRGFGGGSNTAPGSIAAHFAPGCQSVTGRAAAAGPSGGPTP
jgi:hypothetical protein